MGEPFDLEQALDADEFRRDQQKDREYEAYLAVQEARDRGVSPQSLQTLCYECGIKLPEDGNESY